MVLSGRVGRYVNNFCLFVVESSSLSRESSLLGTSERMKGNLLMRHLEGRTSARNGASAPLMCAPRAVTDLSLIQTIWASDANTPGSKTQVYTTPCAPRLQKASATIGSPLLAAFRLEKESYLVLF